MTRQGSVAAMLLRLSTHRASRGSFASLSTLVPNATGNFAYPWPPISAPIARQHFPNGDSKQPGEHQLRHPAHKQFLKSP
jgi:hypothetical protein